jgi:hypothetical protein
MSTVRCVCAVVRTSRRNGTRLVTCAGHGVGWGRVGDCLGGDKKWERTEPPALATRHDPSSACVFQPCHFAPKTVSFHRILFLNTRFFAGGLIQLLSPGDTMLTFSIHSARREPSSALFCSRTILTKRLVSDSERSSSRHTARPRSVAKKRKRYSAQLGAASTCNERTLDGGLSA